MKAALRSRTGALAAFGLAAACYAVGLRGESGSWILAMAAALVLLTVGFFLWPGRERC